MVRLCNTTYPTNSKWEDYFELYPFPLSDFQKYAIEGIVEGHHVLVTAHTGSGKTLPAEFAIEHFAKQGKKVIYTSPIKALSNQKFAEFSRKYPHISFGLLTGDIKTNPDADVLIMTTEILMNALFIREGSSESATSSNLQFQVDIDRELACVVFDEVHYINDPERGQTWEKTILMLPKHVQMVMLSATIDAPERFAEWIESSGSQHMVTETTNKEVYLASTHHRVVPLSHYGYLTVPESTFKLFKDKTLEKEVREATHTLLPLQTDRGVFQEGGHKTLAKMTTMFETKQIVVKRKHVLNNLAMFLRDREMLPAIAFVFSRKQVEQCAAEIMIPLLPDDSKIGYTVRRECEQIVRKLPNYQEYLELPEYECLVKLLENGVGIHHSGMIPILREIVEIMISKKYILLLFATESFAIGLDCPIKTAVFTGLTKFDGQHERLLLSHEYTQMAGRAGRRGIDTVGHVVHCNNLFHLPTATEYRGMLGGKPQKLVSKFRVSYSLVLSLLRRGMSGRSDFTHFIQKSMIYSEIQTAIRDQQTYIVEKKDKLDKELEAIQGLTTPLHVCRAYMAAEDGIRFATNSRRKQLDRELQQIRSEYKTYAEDVAKVKHADALSSECKQDGEELQYLEEYLESQLHLVCDVLQDHGCIKCSHPESDATEPSYTLTFRGNLSAGIAEIHPVITAECLEKWKWFEEFSVVQMIGWMACFTDVKVSGEYAHALPHSDDAFLKARMQEVHEMYRSFENAEGQNQMRTGIDYENAMHFDMPDCAMMWTQCLDEHDCKVFIQGHLATLGISVGDFTKAMLKISTIAKELIAVAEYACEVDCKHKLFQVDKLILKYITTSQSLYV